LLGEAKTTDGAQAFKKGFAFARGRACYGCRERVAVGPVPLTGCKGVYFPFYLSKVKKRR